MSSNYMPSSFPIDIVYLWVNGNDADWRAKRRYAAQSLSTSTREAMAVYGNVEGRFRDNDELRYSLRALEKFFPDHGHIYILTDGQAPEWLRKTPGLTVVDHRDLIPASRLPTFDSGNIESYIHRIPNLSERYFYLNDDVFFGAPVRVNDWFWSGGVYVAWSDDAPVTDEPLRQDATSLENACRLSSQWLNNKFKQASPSAEWALHVAPHYQHTFRTFAHSPRPMLRSLLYELEAQAPDMFSRVRSTVFRVWDKPTIVSDFVLRWALAHGVAKVRDYSHMYVSTGDAQKTRQLDQLAQSHGNLEFFCINDTTDDAQLLDPRLMKVRQTLQSMFAVPSRFEINTIETTRAVKTKLPGRHASQFEPQSAG
jgi:Stealth protein CR2, conserved region 2/Stealth protein CR1, conserved region 1/Stealth protein CR4, conserved region 4